MTLTSPKPATAPVHSVARGATTRDMVGRMLVTGLIAGAAAGVVAIVGWFLVGTHAGTSALVGAGGALLFSVIGHLVQYLCANSRPQIQLVAALVSYATRVGLFGVALALYLSLGDAELFHPIALVSSCAAVVLVWLVAEVIASSRLRILSFDDVDHTHDVDSGQDQEVTR